MSNVIQLFGNGEPPNPSVSFEELLATTEDPGLKQHVQFSISDTLRVARPNIKATTPNLRRVEAPYRRFGVFMPYARMESLIITNENFPNYLIEEGLTKNNALLLAATSLVAYASVHKWMGKLSPRDKTKLVRNASQTFMWPQHPALWTTESFNRSLGQPNSHNIMHRMAAQFALNTCGVEELDPTARPPYPDHIAALADPYKDAEIRSLYATTTSH